MSKITVTTIAGLTSGGDANTVKIESGDAFNVVSGATTLGGAATISGNATFSGDIIKSTSGTSNFCAGVNAGNSITSGGNYNVVVGDEAGTAITTGDENVCIGYQAGDAMTDADRNTAIGYLALTTNTKSDRNTAIGRSALENLDHTSVTSGLNTAIGHGAGSVITTGQKNTIIGSYSGNQGSLDLRTSSNNVILSDGDGNIRMYTTSSGYSHFSNQASTRQSEGIAVHSFQQNDTNQDIMHMRHNGGSGGYGLLVKLDGSPNNTSNYFFSGNDSSSQKIKICSNGNLQNANNSYGSTSDIKLKENIADSDSQWDDIKAVKVKKYSMKTDKLDTPNKLGVIAQDLEASGMSGLVDETADVDPDTKEDLGTTTKSVKYSILYMKAVKALQEAMTRIETLESKVKTLESK